jgi:tetratricopeptide (TPR) repeat protein
MKRLALLLAMAAALWAQAGGVLEQADAAFRAGDLEKAAALARQALAQDPRSVHAHMILGVSAAQGNQWPAAEKHFQSVIKLAPTSPHGYFYLGQAALYQHKWDRAAGYFVQALERGYPDRQRAIVELALALNELGQPEQALESLSKVDAPAAGPMAAQYHAVRAFALGKLNRGGEALEAIRRARDLDRANRDYWEFLIRLLISADDPYKAQGEAIEAQKIFPDDADIQYLFALSSYYVSESPLTGLALRNLREAEPDSERVLLVEGLLYRKQGKAEEAARALTEAAGKGVPDAHVLLGILHKEGGDYEAAEREFRAAEKENPDNGQVMLELGKLLLVRGDLKEAQIRLEKAYAALPDAPGVHYQLGLLYSRLGEKEKAQEHLRLSRQP